MTERINSPYEQFLDMRLMERSEGFCKIGISYKKELTNPHGNYHGGEIASIVDTAAVQGLRTIFPEGPYLTVDVSIRYKKPSNSSQLFAEARARHFKGKFFSSEVKVTDKEQNLVAEARVKSFIPTWENSTARTLKV